MTHLAAEGGRTKEYEAILASLKSAVSATVEARLAPEDIPDDANLYDDCGLDSISIIDFIMEAERRLGVSIPDTELNSEVISKISSLAKCIEAINHPDHSGV